MERGVFGIDVSQATLDIAREGHSEVINIANSTAEIRKWLKSIPSHSMIAVESTGKLHLAVVRAALAAGHILYVLSPRDLHYYARSLGRRAKTDRLDALLIARYLQREHANLHPYQLPSQLQAQLQELLVLRDRHKANGFVTTEKDAINLGGGMAQLATVAVAKVVIELIEPADALDTMLRVIAERKPLSMRESLTGKA